MTVKRLKRFWHRLSHRKKRNLNSIDRTVNKLPYKNLSINKIKRNGKKLIKPVANAVSKSHKYNHKDSRILGFERLKKVDHSGDVKIDGIVAGYKLMYSKFYHQVAVYLLLKNVSGRSYLNKPIFFTDHLWINPNSYNRMIFIKTFSIGLGDYVSVIGKPLSYQGHIGHMSGLKVSLNNAIITNVGYPYIKKDHFTHTIIPYKHGDQCIYKVNAKMHPNVILGNEVRLTDRAFINTHHLLVGYSDDYVLGKVIHKGMQKGTYKKNPHLVIAYSDPKQLVIHNIRWTTNHYSIQHGTVLTSARNLHNHPQETELVIDKRLKDAMKHSRQISLERAEQNIQ